MSDTEIQEEIIRLAWKLLGSKGTIIETEHFSIQYSPGQLSVALENPFRMVFMETKNHRTNEMEKRIEPDLADELLNRIRAVLVLDELADV